MTKHFVTKNTNVFFYYFMNMSFQSLFASKFVVTGFTLVILYFFHDLISYVGLKSNSDQNICNKSHNCSWIGFFFRENVVHIFFYFFFKCFNFEHRFLLQNQSLGFYVKSILVLMTSTQCENVRNLLLQLFYVKSILVM